MAFAPLVLRGSLEINGTDVSDQVSSFTVTGTRDLITIPSTFGAKKSFVGGDDQYELTIEFLSDVDDAAISMILFALLDDAEGTFEFTGRFRDGAVSTSNPEFSGTAVVTSMGDLGGTANTVGVSGSVTFQLTGKPEVSTGA